LDGRLVRSNVGDSEKSSLLAMMGAVMYGSLNSLRPLSENSKSQEEDSRVRAVLPYGEIAVKKEGDKLLIDAYSRA